MARLDDHPTVIAYRQKPAGNAGNIPLLAAADLRQTCLDSGADDCGFVDIDHADLADQRQIILDAYPFAKTLISICKRMNIENVRSASRSLANSEFHATGDDITDVARDIVRKLQAGGVKAGNANMAFPMEMEHWPGRMWIVSHKPVAVAAGLGKMGLHRSVIHPKFGSFILLGSVVAGARVSTNSEPIDYNPCLDCKLCVAACPTGAISPDGHFDFSACYTHNYREFMGGFSDWVDTIADANGAHAQRTQASDTETVSMWQSLAFGPNYKAAYCLSVCPAGEDVIGPYLADRKQHIETIVNPLQLKSETVYVSPRSDAESFVPRRYPHKTLKRVSNGLRLWHIENFITGMPLTFQRGRSTGLNATYHFVFTGREPAEATVTIKNKQISVATGRIGKADLTITADSETWLRFLRKETGMPWALVRRRVKLKGPLKLLLAFAKCFPE